MTYTNNEGPDQTVLEAQSDQSIRCLLIQQFDAVENINKREGPDPRILTLTFAVRVTGPSSRCVAIT